MLKITRMERSYYPCTRFGLAEQPVLEIARGGISEQNCAYITALVLQEYLSSQDCDAVVLQLEYKRSPVARTQLCRILHHHIRPTKHVTRQPIRRRQHRQCSFGSLSQSLKRYIERHRRSSIVDGGFESVVFGTGEARNEICRPKCVVRRDGDRDCGGIAGVGQEFDGAVGDREDGLRRICCEGDQVGLETRIKSSAELPIISIIGQDKMQKWKHTVH